MQRQKSTSNVGEEFCDHGRLHDSNTPNECRKTSSWSHKFNSKKAAKEEREKKTVERILLDDEVERQMATETKHRARSDYEDDHDILNIEGVWLMGKNDEK